ncbi:proteasome subunit beta type [Puccinia sorghi]|uniref:Proteasome subunit beta n=1 Tax=Puccinia sorghi TaxID=27349 RepID=A0A0L6VEL0_9BASI|nr:proteasome subunit beta type [Puccinia sorghi]
MEHDLNMNRLKAGEVNLGTSIMAVAFEGGVVIGADSRTTSGSYIVNRVTDKLTHIHDRVYCCRSGSAADTQAVADYVHLYCQMYTAEHGHAPSVHTLYCETRSRGVETGPLHKLTQTANLANKDNLSAGIIVAGWDAQTKKGSVYNIPLGGGLFQQPWAIGGSGSAYIYGYCDSNYRTGWTKEETVAFVKNALALAMSRDGSSGGTIRMAIITEDKVERVFIPGNQLPVFWEA